MWTLAGDFFLAFLAADFFLVFPAFFLALAPFLLVIPFLASCRVWGVLNIIDFFFLWAGFA
ncbi:MAG: hypothetical protein QXR45_16435 [Candidatus Bathyarchaeia archaeon]